MKTIIAFAAALLLACTTTQAATFTGQPQISGVAELTDGGTNTLFIINVGTNKSAGLRLLSTVIVAGGGDFQSQTSDVLVDAVNKAGTITTYLRQSLSTNGAVSAGTLAVSYLAQQSSDTVLVRVSANSSLESQTSFVARWRMQAYNTDVVPDVVSKP